MKSFRHSYTLSPSFEPLFLISNERCCDSEDVLFSNYLNVSFRFEICACRIEIIRGRPYKSLTGRFTKTERQLHFFLAFFVQYSFRIISWFREYTCKRKKLSILAPYGLLFVTYDQEFVLHCCRWLKYMFFASATKQNIYD